jgi:hypothetical protein
MYRLSNSGLRLLTIAGAVGVFTLATGAVGASGVRTSTTGRVHLRGTAYEFNSVHTMLAGATVRVAELPRLKAIVRRDGTYDLVVPDRARVTPYIQAAGYHTIYLQTFTTAGEDLANVNFQTPSEPVYRGLVALLHVPVDARGDPVRCAIVSTFSTKNVRDLNYAAFVAYGAHGVAGATATAKPALPKPVYFNASVIPDPTQAVSSNDGGVVWADVPTGVYTISGHHPVSRFASFVASCRPGRIVNANPPWGLYQLAPPNPARVSATWSVRGSHAAVLSWTVRRLPANAVVRVRCSGSDCPFASRTFRPTTSTLDLRRALGAPASQLRADQTLEVIVSAHAFNGVVVRWTILAGRTPVPVAFCVPDGDSAPRRHC